jgi:hypothetical protein
MIGDRATHYASRRRNSDTSRFRSLAGLSSAGSFQNLVLKATPLGDKLSEHVRASFREFHERAALMQFQPAAGYRKLKASGVFRRRALVDEQKRAVELLDIDAAFLNGFEGVGVL